MTIMNFIYKTCEKKEVKKTDLIDLFPTNVVEKRLERFIGLHPEIINPLDAVSKITFRMILEQCLEHLLISKYCDTNIHLYTHEQPYEYRTPMIRCVTSHLDHKRFERLPFTNFHKTQEDISFLVNAFAQASDEIGVSGNYIDLMKIIVGYTQEEIDSCIITKKHKANIDKIMELDEKMLHEKKLFLEQLDQWDADAYDLKLKIDHLLIYTNAEVRYTEDWENARCFQNDLKISQYQEEQVEKLHQANGNIENEDVVHQVLCNYMNEATEDLSNLIEYWMQKCDKEIEKKDLEILSLQSDWEQLCDNYKKMNEMYVEREMKMEEWNKQKEEERLANNLEARRIWAAIKIQAWWRGTMVRRFLGPFSILQTLKKVKKIKRKIKVTKKKKK
ncbi:hypothetical protein FQA39_LY05555 [Lamprigera yunnana]|nr:hypothetical protein FQA39_LY05555 [Lamprigera yunnana]